MAIPSWTLEMLRRGIGDVARKASQPETIEKIKTQASEILHDLPQSAARGLDAVMRSADAGKKSVQRWTRKHTTVAVPMLNATGILVNDFGSGVPLAAPVVEVGRELLAGAVIEGPAIQARLSRRVARLLPAGGDHAMAVTTNFGAALAALSVLGRERKLVVHRAHAVRLPGGAPLPNGLATSLTGTPIIEVGSSNRVDVSDFAGMDGFLAILADGGDRPVELFDFNGRDAIQAVVLPIATVAASSDPQIPSAEAMLSAGADIVVLTGDGLCGGPACGILIGRSSLIAQIQSTSVWKLLAAGEAIEAMMVLAMETAGAAGEPLPITALIQTSEENLRGRAERLATRFGGDDAIASCQVTAADARLTGDGRWRFPSRQIRLRHVSRSAEDWASELKEEVPAIFASTLDDDLIVDLRWIAAADDGKLAEALGSPGSS